MTGRVSMHRFSVVLISLLLLVACGKEESKSIDKPHRDEATAFTLRGLDGREYSLESARGNVVLLDFWATWCPPCKKEIPELISLYKKYKNEKFLLWGIGLDNQAALESFSQKFGIPYPILLGTQEVQSAYGVRAIPTVFILDRLGRVAARFQGYREGMETQFDEEIRGLLDE
jgi:thiol-disulfide isomerase/thioredoxin